MAFFTSYWIIDLLVVFGTILTAIYYNFRTSYEYWRRKRVPQPFEPTFPLGHFKGMYTKKTLALLASDMYGMMKKEPFFGCYLFKKPILVVKDPELIKAVIVKDFSSFHDRGFEANVDKDPLLQNISVLNGQAWRNLRIKLTPTFTTGKMKMMFPTLMSVGKHLEQVLEKSIKEPNVDIKDILGRYTTDVISTCAFGIEVNSLGNPDVEFRKMGQFFVRPGLRMIVANLLAFSFPKYAKYSPLRFVPSNVNDFFMALVRDTMDYRKENNVKRNDFLQLLMQLREKGYIADADNPVTDESVDLQQKFTQEQAAAQAFVFFLAGFETSSLTMQYALYELALNPDLQKKVQDEIDGVKAKFGGEATYEAMQQMELLDRVVSETLRKYPISPFLMRQCNTEYTIPNSDVIIDPETFVWIPIYGIHHDPDIYPDPEKFDPDRFLPEEIEKRPQYSYLPFGEGPRSCIGNRFALMQTKAGLIISLAKFSVSPSAKTPIPIEFSKKNDMLNPKEILCLKLNLRQ